MIGKWTEIGRAVADRQGSVLGNLGGGAEKN